MPNGFYGSKQDWQFCDQPLEKVEEICRRFAIAHGMNFSINDRDWPSRELRWGNPLRKKIGITLHDEKGPTYSVGAVVWLDEHGARYWRQEVIQESIPSEELGLLVPHLLELAYERADSWGRSDLAFATKLSED